MQIDESYIESEVYTTTKDKSGKDIFFVKISFLDVGFYINSITVKHSPKYPEKGLWVQPPKYTYKGQWKQHLEFSGDSSFWKLIEEVTLKAIHDYCSNDWVPTEEELNNPAKALDEAIQGLSEEPP